MNLGGYDPVTEKRLCELIAAQAKTNELLERQVALLEQVVRGLCGFTFDEEGRLRVKVEREG